MSDYACAACLGWCLLATIGQQSLHGSGYCLAFWTANSERKWLVSELPSKSLLAQKLKQVEDNAPHVEDLRDVTSAEDAEVESYLRLLAFASSQDTP